MAGLVLVEEEALSSIEVIVSEVFRVPRPRVRPLPHRDWPIGAIHGGICLWNPPPVVARRTFPLWVERPSS